MMLIHDVRVDLAAGVVVFSTDMITPNYYVLDNGLRFHLKEDGSCTVNGERISKK